jgi:hypothetical protein
MKKLPLFQMNYLINRKGQSMVELSVCGAILLLCLGALVQYGMVANYQQSMQMQAFRKAIRVAYHKHGPGSGSSVAMTHDKRIPDASDPFGLGKRTPISGGGGVTFDANLYEAYTQAGAPGTYIKEYSDSATPATKHLPQMIVEINDTLSLPESSIDDQIIDTIGFGEGALTTASYKRCGCNGVLAQECGDAGNISVAAENTGSGDVYISNIVNCNNIQVNLSEADTQVASVRIGGLKQNLSSGDFDNDGFEESVVFVAGTSGSSASDCDSSDYCGTLSKVLYLDNETGLINPQMTVVHPWEDNKGTLADQQGLLPGFNVREEYHANIAKEESPDNITTTTTYGDTKQVTTHTLSMNGPFVVDYQTEFVPDDFTWSVPK